MLSRIFSAATTVADGAPTVAGAPTKGVRLTRRARLSRTGRLAAGGAHVLKALATGDSFPFSMTFILTNRCNFRCSYCNIPATASEEMDTDTIKAALTEMAGLGLVRASFSGGEVLLRDDALQIIRHAKELGLMTSLNSNAWFAMSRIDELAECLDLLVLSLDGGRAIHDHVRRQKGSYDRVITTLDAAYERGLATATITVISQENIAVMDEVIALVDAHHAYAYFQPAYENCFDFRDGFDPNFARTVFVDMADRLDRAHRDQEPIGASPGYVRRLALGPNFDDCSRCSAGRFWATVLPDGTLIPCHLQLDQPGDTPWPNGLQLGFSEAFLRLKRRKTGPGCAISPYQETDLIFKFNAAAIRSALRRLR